MKLFRRERWYNPFFVEVNGVSKKLNTIRVYKNGEILIHHNSGWFTDGRSSNNPVQELGIPGECVLKRKVNLDLTTNFVVSVRDYVDDSCYDLYIYADNLLTDPSSYEYQPKANLVMKRTKVSAEGLTWITFTDARVASRILSDLYSKVNVVGEELKRFIYSDNISKTIETLTAMNDEIEEEKARLGRLSAEEIWNNAEQKG